MNIFAIRKNAARCIVLGLLFSFTAPFQAAYAGSNNLTVSAGEQPQQQVVAQALPLEQLVLRAFESDASRAFDLNASILDEHAAKELQLDWVANTLDRTQTYVGSNCLAQSLNPTNDVEEIERRQLLIKTFIDDAHTFNAMDIALHDIAKNEQAVLSYWNEKDALWLNASRLYFNLGPFKSFNNSPLALNAITLFDAGSNFKTLVGTLFLQGFFNELYKYSKFGTFISSEKVVEGAYKILSDHNFLTAKYMNGALPEGEKAFQERGIDVYTDGTFLDNVRYKEVVFNRQNGVLDRVAQWLFGRRIFSNSVSEKLNKLSAWGEQIALMAVYDYMLYKSVMSAKDGIKDAYRNIEGLRLRMTAVADFIKAVQKIERLVNENAALQYALPAKVKNDIALSKNLSAKMHELVALLNTATFKGKSSIIYNRGKVLYANLLFSQIKHELVPAMKAVGEIDAYCSVARLVKDSLHNQNRFTFVTFTDTAQAYLELDSCWISVLNPDEAVANSMTLGKTKPGKVIITGPNGGGKSTWLKAAGQAVVLAQAWGIVPARKAHMSIFDAVRTSLEPRENLAGGISKFMAQKESMDKIQRFVLEEQNKVALILLDEPYDGTVTDEIARRAGEFCDNVVTSNNCLAIIATHVMPHLENEKMYGWFHVDIAEPRKGEFRRTFRLRSGLAKRWFNDPSWRGRFIDWLSLETRKKAIAEAKAKAEQDQGIKSETSD